MKIKVNGEEKKIELNQENALLSTALNLMGYKRWRPRRFA